MKKSSTIIVVFIIIALVIIFFSFNFIIKTTDEKKSKPQAVIEIKKVVAGELEINQGEVIYFSAINSSDEDGKIENYYWDFDDGNSSNTINPTHKYEEPGIYYVTLTVTDNDGNKNITSIRITVINSKPIAKINIENQPVTETGGIPIYHNIQFTSIGTYDSDGNITLYTWDFGDGNYSNEPNPKYRYDSIGKFQVTLTVVDDDKETAEDYLDLEVILRTYEITWKLEQTDKTLTSNGYTREGESTEILDQIDQNQIAKVNIQLNWTDRQPLLKNNQTQGEDLFELKTVTPENKSAIENSTSGVISINVEYIFGISDSTYQAKTANEAINFAITDAGFSKGGIGEWYYNVTAIECKGGNWNNENFDFDIGNFWDLKIVIYFYSFEIEDISLK